MSTFEQIIGKKSCELSLEAFLEKCASYQQVWLDLGTGDGKFAYRIARAEPETLVVGIDTDRSSLSKGSAKTRRKESAGGCRNLLFLCADALALPQVLQGVFARAYINFPWGSLLRAVVEPDIEFLRSFRAALCDHASVEIYINTYVFSSAEQRQTLQLEEITTDRIEKHIVPLYEDNGFICKSTAVLGEESATLPASTWAGRLVKASRRETLQLILEAR